MLTPAPFTLVRTFNEPPPLNRIQALHMLPNTNVMKPFAFLHENENDQHGRLVSFSSPFANVNKTLQALTRKYRTRYVFLAMQTVGRHTDPSIEPHLQHALASGTINENTLLPDDHHLLVISQFTPEYTCVQINYVTTPDDADNNVFFNHTCYRDITRHPLGITPFTTRPGAAA